MIHKIAATIQVCKHCSDLGLVCLAIQTLLGIEDGGEASHHFENIDWINASTEFREAELCNYIEAEIRLATYL